MTSNTLPRNQEPSKDDPELLKFDQQRFPAHQFFIARVKIVENASDERMMRFNAIVVDAEREELVGQEILIKHRHDRVQRAIYPLADSAREFADRAIGQVVKMRLIRDWESLEPQVFYFQRAFEWVEDQLDVLDLIARDLTSRKLSKEQVDRFLSIYGETKAGSSSSSLLRATLERYETGLVLAERAFRRVVNESAAERLVGE